MRKPFLPSSMHRIFLLNGPRSPKSARPSVAIIERGESEFLVSLVRQASVRPTPHLFLVDFITGRLGEQHEKSRRNQGDKHKSDFDAAANRQHKLSQKSLCEMSEDCHQRRGDSLWLRGEGRERERERGLPSSSSSRFRGQYCSAVLTFVSRARAVDGDGRRGRPWVCVTSRVVARRRVGRRMRTVTAATSSVRPSRSEKASREEELVVFRCKMMMCSLSGTI